ncbi:MAG: alpha-glucosidase/alpha-galactosidase, partial [Chloroflexi bacterium]|nr:alpha-glucosidase/alpha-galactosidase [Chloroflexota bacterium]
LIRSNINVQALAVKAILEKDLESATHAIMQDPLTASVLSLDDARQMANEMFAAQPEYFESWTR